MAEDIIIRLEKSTRTNKIKRSSEKMKIKLKADPPSGKKNLKVKLIDKNSSITNDELHNYRSNDEKPIVHGAGIEHFQIIETPVNLVIEENITSTRHQQSTEIMPPEDELVIDLTDQNQTIEPVRVSSNAENANLHKLLLTNLTKIHETQCSIDYTLKLMLAEMKRNH